MRHRLRIRRIEVQAPGLAKEHTLTLAFLSDFHHSAVVPLRQIREAVDMANAQGADVILMGGDYVTRQRRYIHDCISELKRLEGRLGVFAVLGNHDLWVDASAIAAALKQAGFRILQNEAAALTPGSSPLYLVGIEDAWQGKPDIEAAFRGVPAEAVTIVLSHNPDVVYLLGDRRPALILCGHTHGGQVRGLGRLFIPSRFGRRHPAGLFRWGSTPIYITTGVGEISPPVRLFCPPEVAIVTLMGLRPSP